MPTRVGHPISATSVVPKHLIKPSATVHRARPSLLGLCSDQVCLLRRGTREEVAGPHLTGGAWGLRGLEERQSLDLNPDAPGQFQDTAWPGLFLDGAVWVSWADNRECGPHSGPLFPQRLQGQGWAQQMICGPHWGPGCRSIVCGFFQRLYRQERTGTERRKERGRGRREALCSGHSLCWVIRQVGQEDQCAGVGLGPDREQSPLHPRACFYPSPSRLKHLPFPRHPGGCYRGLQSRALGSPGLALPGMEKGASFR